MKRTKQGEGHRSDDLQHDDELGDERVEDETDEQRAVTGAPSQQEGQSQQQDKRAANRAARIASRREDPPPPHKTSESDPDVTLDEERNQSIPFDYEDDRPGAIRVEGPDANENGSTSIMFSVNDGDETTNDAGEGEGEGAVGQSDRGETLLPEAQPLPSVVVEGYTAGGDSTNRDSNIEDYVAQRIAVALEEERRNAIQAEAIDLTDPEGERGTEQRHRDIEASRNDTKTARQSRFRTIQSKYMMALALVVFVVVIIVVAFVIRSDPANEGRAASLPSAAPTHDLFPILLRLMVSRNVLWASAGYHEDSPQIQALQWLSYQDSYEGLSAFDPNDEDGLVQRYVLALFYYATTDSNVKWNIDNSWWLPNDRSHWLSNSSVCEWYGLTCDADMHYVTQMQLGRNNLIGELPSEIGTLTRLSVLSLHHNPITGSIPSEIRHLSNLTSVALSGTGIIGDVNSIFCDAESNFTQFHGNFSHLHFVDFDSNIDAVSCDCCCSNVSCSRYGQVADVLKSTRGVLNIANREEAIEWVAYDDPLHLLPLNDSVPDGIIERYVLTVFYFVHVENIYFNSEPSVKDSAQYEGWLSGKSVCEWQGIDCTLIDGSNRVTSFSTSDPNPTHFEFIAVCPPFVTPNGERLERCFSNSCCHPPSGPIPVEIGILSHLREIVFYDSSFTGTIITEIGLLSELRKLEISCRNCNDGGPGDSNHTIHGGIPTEFGNLQHLERLDLSENNLEGSIITELGVLRNLRYLDLASNGLRGGIPAVLGNLGALQVMNISSNALNGTLPSYLGTLKAIELIDFGANLLTGSIPTDYANLRSLTSIYIGQNGFTGDVNQIFCDIDDDNESISTEQFPKLWGVGLSCHDEMELELDCDCCSCFCSWWTPDSHRPDKMRDKPEDCW